MGSPLKINEINRKKHKKYICMDKQRVPMESQIIEVI